ncbi:hypothetical protein CVS40_1842, partial [Lucilia cuprina]
TIRCCGSSSETCLNVYLQAQLHKFVATKGDEKGRSFKIITLNNIINYRRLGRNVSLDYNCSMQMLYIGKILAPFFESERVRIAIQMWWLIVRGSNCTLFANSTSLDRAQLHLCDICNSIILYYELLPLFVRVVKLMWVLLNEGDVQLDDILISVTKRKTSIEKYEKLNDEGPKPPFVIQYQRPSLFTQGLRDKSIKLKGYGSNGSEIRGGMSAVSTAQPIRRIVTVRQLIMPLEIRGWYSDFIAEVVTSGCLEPRTSKNTHLIGNNHLQNQQNYTLKILIKIPYPNSLTGSLKIEYVTWLQDTTMHYQNVLGCILARRCDFQEDAKLQLPE